MHLQIQNDFLSYAYLHQSKPNGGEAIRKFPTGDDECEDLYIKFANKTVGYIQRWEHDKETSTVTIEHFAVDKDLEGHKFGEPLIRGFAKAAKQHLKIGRIIFMISSTNPGYPKLLTRIGAVKTEPVDWKDWWIWDCNNF